MDSYSFLFLLGITAGTFTTIAFVPQVIKAHKSRQTKDLSLLMLSLILIGLVLWIIYGLLIFAKPVVIANSVTLILVLYLISLKLRYG